MPSLGWGDDIESRLKVTVRGLKELLEAAEALKEFDEAFSKLGIDIAEGAEYKKEWRDFLHGDDEDYYKWMDIGDFFMAKKTKSPFRKGRTKSKSGAGGSQFLSIKDGESFTFAPLVGLDGMISADMHEYWDIRPAIYHPCIGRGCPGCEVKNDSRFKGYLPIMMKDGEVMVFPFTISVYNQLETLEDTLEDDGENLKGFVIKVSRKGSSLSTRYSILGVGKRLDMEGKEVPDFVPQLGPQTADDIWELLEDNGFSRGETFDTKPVVETPTEEASEESSSDDDEGWGDV